MEWSSDQQRMQIAYYRDGGEVIYKLCITQNRNYSCI